MIIFFWSSLNFFLLIYLFSVAVGRGEAQFVVDTVEIDAVEI